MAHNLHDQLFFQISYSKIVTGFGTISHISKCAYFKKASFRYAMCNLNQMWVFYGGRVAAAMTRKWSLRTAPSKSFGAEFRAFAIAASFSKNGTTTKARTSGMERASDF